MSNFKKVGKFMETFGQEVKNKASFPTEKIQTLRYDLIAEEVEELRVALKNRDIKEVADALTDILYVTYGAGHAFGINLDACFDDLEAGEGREGDLPLVRVLREPLQIRAAVDHTHSHLEQYAVVERFGRVPQRLLTIQRATHKAKLDAATDVHLVLLLEGDRQPLLAHATVHNVRLRQVLELDDARV